MDLAAASLFLAAVVAVAFFSMLYRRGRRPSSSSSSTVLKPYPVVGTLPYLLKNGPRFHNYPKGQGYTSVLRDFLGDGIFNSDGEQWKLQRKAASFEFNTKSIRAFIADNNRRELHGSLLPILGRAADAGSPVDVQDLFERFAFDNVCTLVFNEDPKCLAGGNKRGADFFHAFEDATALSVDRMRQPVQLLWRFKRWLDVGSERNLRVSVKAVHDYVSDFVFLRKHMSDDIGGDGDLLSRFMTSIMSSSTTTDVVVNKKKKKDDVREYGDEFLRDILISSVLAGRDTSPSALTWVFWVLSLHPNIVRKVQEEVAQVRGKSNRPLPPPPDYYDNTATPMMMMSLEELREMHYLHAAISEALRLYPPVPLQMRRCEEDDVLPDGTKVRKGLKVMYNSMAMGRMESIWGPDCGEIRPERWLQDGTTTIFKQAKSSFEYPVFHGGPRMCLGKDMAYMQMKAVTACILERFDIESAAAEGGGKSQLSMSLKMEGGLPLRFKKRMI